MNLLSLLHYLGFFRKKEDKRLGEDQLRRRLHTIDFHQGVLRRKIEFARKYKKERKSLYAQMEALTTERLQIEGQLRAGSYMERIGWTA